MTSHEAPLTVAAIHAVLPAIAPIREALSDLLPSARVLNILDEGLLSEVERHGGLTPECVDRLSALVRLAIEAGADVVLLTCTAYSPVAGLVQSRHPATPLIAVDRAMVEEAVIIGSRIGILATVRAGLEQQEHLLREAAAEMGKQITTVSSLHPEAFTALDRGHPEVHDSILLRALPKLAADVDVVLLAQASMARLVPNLPPDLQVPVLSSPKLAVERLRRVTHGE